MLQNDIDGDDAGRWKRSRFCAPAMNTLSVLASLSSQGSIDDYFTMSVSELKRTLRSSLFTDLNSHWSGSKWATTTHLIHPVWNSRKLPTSMHCRYSHVLYNCAAVNRAPLRRWLYKTGRAKSELCRHGCNVVEDLDHVLNACHYVSTERTHLHFLCNKNACVYSYTDLFTNPGLQIGVEKLLLAFMEMKS